MYEQTTVIKYTQ